jgi:hypothetical protein
MRKLAILAMLLIGGCSVYYFRLRRPHFSGDSPISVDLHVTDVASTNIYQMSITNRAACEALVKELRRASPTFGGSAVIGEITFRYADDKTDTVYILPGPYQQYTILQNGTVTVPTNSFFKVLADGGVDVSKIR